MSDTYCPPPDPLDYLENEIVYPSPKGKESTKSTDLTHNDINFDDPKVEKSQTNLEDDIVKTKKLQARIQPDFRSKSSKSQTTLRAVGDRPTKSRRNIYHTQVNILKKAVNEI